MFGIFGRRRRPVFLAYVYNIFEEALYLVWLFTASLIYLFLIFPRFSFLFFRFRFCFFVVLLRSSFFPALAGKKEERKKINEKKKKINEQIRRAFGPWRVRSAFIALGSFFIALYSW